MSKGFFIVPRDLADLPFWQEKPFQKALALIDLYRLANWKDGKIITKRGIMVDVKRGQVGWSFRLLADRWGWSPNKVKCFLLQLKDCSQISMQNSNVTTLITMIHYDTWNVDGTQNNTQTGHIKYADGTQTDPINTKESLSTKNSNNKKASAPSLDESLMPPPLKALKKVTGYKFDLMQDGNFLLELMKEFPMVDAVSMLNGWRAYKIDVPFKPKDNQRSQLRNQFEMAKKHGRHKKLLGNGAGGMTDNDHKSYEHMKQEA